MTNYRRLISYIYAYEGGIKGKNVGFAKLEVRNGQCKIQVNVRNVFIGSQDTGVYLLSGADEILVGKIFIRNGAGEFRTMVSVNNVAGSGQTIDQCFGLTVHNLADSWQSYTTIWEDAVAHAAEVALEEATSEQIERREQKENGTAKPAGSVAKAVEMEIEAQSRQEEMIRRKRQTPENQTQPSSSPGLSSVIPDSAPEREPEDMGTMEIRPMEVKPIVGSHANGQEPEDKKPLPETGDCGETPGADKAELPGMPENAEAAATVEKGPHGPSAPGRRDQPNLFGQPGWWGRPGVQMRRTSPGRPMMPPRQEAGPKSEPRPRSEAPPKPRLESQPELPMQPETPFRSEVSLQSEASPRPEGLSQAKAPSQPEIGPQSEVRPGPEAAPVSELAPQPEVGPNPEVAPGPEIQPVPRITPGSEPMPVPEITPQPEVGPNPEVMPGPEIQPVPRITPGPEPMPAPEIMPQPEVRPVPELAPQPEIQPPPAVQSRAQLRPESQPQLEPADEEPRMESIWQQFYKRYPKIQAFDYNGGCDILTIKPQDIGLLPREIWTYGNNSFLLHGYYSHRYIIFARLGGLKGRIRYLLGVPGHYYSNEKYMASMFGFPNFVLSKIQPEGDGRFGYWYTDVRLGS